MRKHLMRNQECEMPQIRIGRLSTGEGVWFDMSAPQSVAIGGMTRSGKSAATYHLLSQLAGHAPQVELSVVDITSVLGRPLVENGCAENVCLGTFSAEKALKVVENVRDEMRERVRGLWEKRADKVTQFTADYPLHVLVVEELPGTVEWLQDDDAAHGRKPGQRLAPKFIAALRVILAEGLKVGVCVLLLAQRFDANVISGAARANLSIRIGLRVDDRAAAEMLFPGIDRDATEMLARAVPGRGLISAPGLREEKIALDWLSYEAYLQNLGVGKASHIQ